MADHVYKFSEIPKGQRWKFFWDYYKIPTALIMIGVIALILILQTTVFAPKKDLAILSATQIYVARDTWQQAEEGFSSLPLDLNEDGRILVEINDNYMDSTMRETDPQTYMVIQSKLMASLSTAESALQIVDDDTYAYFEEQALLGTYAELPSAMGHNADEVIKIPLKELKPFKAIQDLPDGLFMTLRPKAAMQLGDSEKKLADYEKQIEALFLMIES